MSTPDPAAGLSRTELAVLVREYLLAGQLMDRAGMPHVIGAYGREEMGRIAIDEWMGASPIYTRRMQALLRFGRGDIETLFKGLQLDIGAPPEFMDFRLRVIDEHHGEFHLDHCGALMDVEPMGDEFVRTMCHDIEDPTFDATAMATSPFARIRPVHRPPRTPADRHPHCHWTATIDPTREPLAEPEPATHVAATLLAAVPVPEVVPEGGGWHDYAGPLDPDLRFESFSRNALLGLAHEVTVQTHLLVMSFLFAIERRHGTADATSIGARQFAGSAGLTSARLRAALHLDASAEGLAHVLALHPVFRPAGYVAAEVTPLDATSVELVLHPCPATAEPVLRNWLTLLVDGAADGALDALVQGVDPHYRCRRLTDETSAVHRWRIEYTDTPAPESSDVALTRFSTGATFTFSETPVELI